MAEPELQIHETPSGVRYGLWGGEVSLPSPLLIILSATIEESLGQDYFRQCGNALARAHNFLCVSIDLPAHGPQQREVERAGLDGWRDRVDHNEDFVAINNTRLRDVLDHLIGTGQVDPARIAICGTSRGGFMALQFAAADSRVQCVAAFAPVTELAALHEFHSAADNPFVASLALVHRADALATRPVWVAIGDRDERVDTDAAIRFVRAMTKSALARGLSPQVELWVVPEPQGHTTPRGSAAAAATWIVNQFS